MLDDLACHQCGYDLRAHAADGNCPECNASVAESRRLAAVPLRPAWRDSDPRWRRRMLAGVWILVLLPLMDAVRALEWENRVRVPSVFGYPGTVETLDQTFLSNMSVYQPLVFCIGVVLLFSKERGRRRGRLDWTRRWGVLCSYVILLLSAAPVLFITALVMCGISALFLSMPPKYQPGFTQWFIDISAAYLRYGPYPKDVSLVVLVAFSSVVILLACVPLFDALRSTGQKRLGAVLLAPLAVFSLLYLALAVRHYASYSRSTATDFVRYGAYFRPELVLRHLAELSDVQSMPGPMLVQFFVEVVKWCTTLAIAVWLSVATFASKRQGKKSTA